MTNMRSGHDMCYIFEKSMVRGPQKQCSWVSDLKIHKYKYTNTQIHKYANTALVKVADKHDMCYIFEKVMVRGPHKQCSRVSDLQIHKYKYTNTQIHKYTNTQIQHRSKLQIDIACVMFLKRL